MSVGIGSILDALASIAAATGRFERVNRHEPKKAQGSRLSASVFLGPEPMHGIEGSGLASVSVRVQYTIQIRQSMLSEPQDGIDPEIGDAVDDVITALCGNFNLDIAGVRMVDLLGAYGDGIMCNWGYIEHDHKFFRVADIYVPVIVNDAWSQVA